MEKEKYLINEEGTCPVCKERDFYWGDSECTGDCIWYEWECNHCHAQGREWYRLVFDGHSVLVNEKDECGNDYTSWEDVNDYKLPIE